MNKIVKILVIFGLVLHFFSPNMVHAIDATDTWAVSADGYWIQIQTAYEATLVINHEEITRPQDVFVTADNIMYVADSHHGYIVVLNEERQMIDIIGDHYLQSPTGVFVTPNGDIFVADTDHVFQFAESGALLNQFGRPDSPMFGVRQPFRPRQLAVDARGNIYIVGEAAVNGLIQLSADGEFLGYFGANQTRLTLFQAMQNFLLGGGRFANEPVPPTNLAIADNGIVFTVTANLESERIKMLNIAGNNMLGDIWADDRVLDVAVGNRGNFYTLADNGWINAYDPVGNFLFSFGGQEVGAQRLGIVGLPTSIATSPTGNLYVSDADSGLIHTFIPTEFTQNIHQALMYFEEGDYDQSEAYWNEVLRANAMFALAHDSIGRSEFIQANFEAARHHFYLAQNIDGYSEAFWEIRHEWLTTYVGWIILAAIAIPVVRFFIRKIDEKTGYFSKRRFRIKTPFGHEFFKQLRYMKLILKHPIDTFYDLKREKKRPVVSATVLYVSSTPCFYITIYGTGFIFKSNIAEDIGIFLLTAVFVLVVGLFVIFNYLISTISDGEGSFANVYVGTAYSLSPFILFGIPITLLTHVLTLNEAFVYAFLLQIVAGWSLLLVFLMVKEIHDFQVRETFKNLILTVSGSLIAVVVTFVLYLLIVNQLAAFIMDVIVEVLIHV